jgi:GT2 family glycosyltransferase
MTPGREEEAASGHPLRVAAVVVTYNRSDVLPNALTGLLAQSRPLNELIVVDNASTDGTTDMLAADFPTACLVRMSENLGPGGGFAQGIGEAVSNGNDWVWVFNDDDVPDPDALEALLDAVVELPARTGILGSGRREGLGRAIPLGGRWTGFRHRSVALPADTSGAPVALDVLTFSGSLVSAALVREVGVPKIDYFMMVEDFEYCLRARRAGWGVYALPRPLVVSLALGSQGQARPWRGYYQTRNQLAMALEHRSLRELWWWAFRNAKFCAGAVRSRDRPGKRLRMRALGAWHALRGVSGRTIAPEGVGIASSEP